MPFLSEDMATDVREFGERLSRRLKHKPKFEIAPLVASLDDLSVDQDVEALQCVMEALEAADGFDTVSAHDARLRIRFYLASCGHPQAAAAIAGETAAVAFGDVRDYSDFSLVSRALAWSLVAHTYGPMSQNALLQWPRSRVGSDLRSYAREFEAAIRAPEDETKQPEDKSAPSETAEEMDAGELAWQSNKPKTAVIVFRAIGNDSTSEGKRVAAEFKKLLNVRLPLPPVPDLARVRTRLVEEFPYAVAVIDDLLKRLVGRDNVHLRPTILVEIGRASCRERV